MDVLGDAIARDRRSDRPALDVPAVGRQYDYRRFCTSAWKTGNFLRHLGVREDVGVGVADDPTAEPVLTLYGAAALGGVVRFGPPAGIDDGTRALVVPTADLDAHDVGPATKRVVYGDPPADPDVSYFERDVWSENPTEPPNPPVPADPLLRANGERYSHGEVLSAAESVVDDHGIGPDSAVAVRGSFASPAVVVAGLVAPIVAGGRLSVGPESDGDLVVGGRDDDVGALGFQ
jgi:hypothetical protein